MHCPVLDVWIQVVLVFFPAESLCFVALVSSEHCFDWSKLQWQTLNKHLMKLPWNFTGHKYETATSVSTKRRVHYHLRTLWKVVLFHSLRRHSNCIFFFLGPRCVCSNFQISKRKCFTMLILLTMMHYQVSYVPSHYMTQKSSQK